ncbi:MAG TPA: serine/threonine-protein kinase [Vicinamibacteria bacterium]|nr:serine/threonine-protein kinase [Vicinamibacteria bacterium]
MTEPTGQDPIPPVVGRYEILRELGRGSMGVVYEAHDPALSRNVALKTIQPVLDPKDKEAFEQRFFAEARIAARLSHPGIVVVHDVGRDPDTGILYIALEHLTGRTLAEMTDGGHPLEWREALRLGAEIARALHHAHEQGVVHRDMKPANIMVLSSGQAKIMDFGIARVETARFKLTSPGEFLGTPLYMAPEQALSGTVDRRTDVFSLGGIVYTLVAGQPAFAAASLPQIVARLVKEDAAPPSSLIPGLPPHLDQVLARAMAKEPDDRYPHARALAEDLEDLLEGRIPRHLTGTAPPEVELVLAEEDPLEQELHALVPDAAPPPTVGAPTATHPPSSLMTGRVSRSVLPPGGRHVGLWAGLVVAGLGAWAYLGLRSRISVPTPVVVPAPAPSAAAPSAPTPTSAPLQPSHSASPPAPRASTLASPPAAVPSKPKRPQAEPGHLHIDFDHPLEAGTLRVWVDDELVVDQKLSSRVHKEALVFKVRRGNLMELLDVSPGNHEVRVQVKWEDNDKTERISGVFKAGVTKRLEASLGWLRKNLSLDWK